jgi:branched-chain amino acid transport system permease protein
LQAAGAFWALLRYTKLGLALRAVSTNAESASLSGDPRATHADVRLGIGRQPSAWSPVSATVGTADLRSQLHAGRHYLHLCGRHAWVGSTARVGAVVGGLIVGVLITETLPYYVDAIGGEFQLMPAFVLILVVLLVRPQGSVRYARRCIRV